VISFSKDEVHNEYALQDQMLQIMDFLIVNYPRRLLLGMFDLWVLPGSREEVEVRSCSFCRIALVCFLLLS